MNRRRRRTVAVIFMAVLAAVCLPVGLFHLKSIDDASKRDHRHLSLSPIQKDDLRIPDDNIILELFKAFDEAGILSAPVPRTQISPYTLDDVISVLPTFDGVVGVVIYDPDTDNFILHYSNNMKWKGGCHKLVGSFRALAHSLRSMFPDRFAKGSGQPELPIAISSGDYPEVSLGIGQGFSRLRRNRNCFLGRKKDGVSCVSPDLAPVLQFGSAFKSPEIYPSMIAMPMPQNNHVACFETFAAHPGAICPMLLPRVTGNPRGLVFEETVGLGWDELIPSVVWRGTDFSYLHRLYPRLRQPNFETDVGSKLKSSRIEYNSQEVAAQATREAATQAMRKIYDQLIPRWKSVVWTAEAEREAEEKQKQLPEDSEEVVVPWANMKFAGAMHAGKKTPTSEIPYYQEFEEHGIPASGEEMDLETLARYKYHIDTGGGGGTTWSGTLEKLGLPGMLFHHETPMKDYLHDKMVKWVHYVPIKEDLSDLKEKFVWAESHPELAKQISDNATRLAKSLGTPEGFSIMFDEFYETPLRAVVEAYTPLTDSDHWMDVVVNNDLRPIIQCLGYSRGACEGLVDDVTFTRGARHDRNFQRSERRE